MSDNDQMSVRPLAPLQAGDTVPDFILSTLDGATISSAEIRSSGLLLAVLFRTGCGTCKLAFPFVQRLHQIYAQNSGGRFTVLGVSQDDATMTAEFAQNYGAAAFSLAVDERLDVSNRFGITNVPNLYLLGSSDRIQDAVVGHFSADGYNRIAAAVANYLGVSFTPVVQADDDVPALKPG